MPHPEWSAMSDEQKMDLLYEWCAQISIVVQELRSTNETLMNKVVEIQMTLASMQPPHVLKRGRHNWRPLVEFFHCPSMANLRNVAYFSPILSAAW